MLRVQFNGVELWINLWFRGCGHNSPPLAGLTKELPREPHDTPGGLRVTSEVNGRPAKKTKKPAYTVFLQAKI